MKPLKPKLIVPAAARRLLAARASAGSRLASTICGPSATWRPTRLAAYQPRPGPVLRVAGRAIRREAHRPRAVGLHGLAPDEEARPGQHRPAHGGAEDLLSLLAARRDRPGQPGRAAGHAEDLAARAGSALAGDGRAAARGAAAAAMPSGGATGRCSSCCTPPAAGRRRCRTCKLRDLHLDERYCLAHGKGTRTA